MFLPCKTTVACLLTKGDSGLGNDGGRDRESNGFYELARSFLDLSCKIVSLPHQVENNRAAANHLVRQLPGLHVFLPSPWHLSRENGIERQKQTVSGYVHEQQLMLS